MKRFISLLLCLVLALSMIPAASADNAKNGHSKLFKEITAALDKKKLEYEADDYDADQDEHIEVIVSCDDVPMDVYSRLTYDVYINSEYKYVEVLCFNIIKYDKNISDKEFNNLLSTVNDLNRDYRYVKFYCDPEYNSVGAEFTCYVRTGTAGEVTLDMLEVMSYIVDGSYEELGAYSVD